MPENPSFKNLPQGEPVIGETYRERGWAYRSSNGMVTQDEWYDLMEFLGDEAVILAQTSVHREGQVRMRGQYLVSPKGLEMLRDRDFRNATLDDGMRVQ